MAIPVQLFIACLAFMIKVTSPNLLTCNGVGPPELRNYDDRDSNNRISVHHQAIIPTYKFDCCGNITKWAADVYSDDQMYSLDFQVFRPSPTVDDSTGAGCYSLVGINRFTSISLSNGIVEVTPSPQDYITFQPQDVLGFYVRSASIRSPDKIPNGLVLQTSPSRFTSELVWYADSPPQLVLFLIDDCSYSVGHRGYLASSTKAAPVISVDITTFPCDGSTPSQTSPSSTMSLTSTVTTPVQVDHVLRSTAASSSVHSSTSQAPVIRETSVQPNPTSCTHASKSATPITLIHTSNANVTLSTSAPPRVEQIPWLLIGCVTAAVVAIILITTFTVFCFLKRGGKRHNQTETVMDEHFYDCVSYGVSAQISNHPKVVTDDHVHDSYAPIETVMNEAYATNEWNSIEINQNVAYDVYARIMTATDSQLYDNI